MPERGPAPEVSARMKRVRQQSTAPELAVRRLLWNLGIRYRTCVRDLPGSPDIASKKHKWAIFVNGCFWHGHADCRLATVPKTNRSWWLQKIDSNRERDARKCLALHDLGYRVLTVWQCELSNAKTLERRLKKEICS